MKVLVACEFSGIVRDAFIKRGHDAMSCDLLPTEAPGPHYEGSVFDIIDNGFDLMIAHPPCTYLTATANRAFINNPKRWKNRYEAMVFVWELINTAIEKIAIENPIGVISSHIRKPEQIIQPYYFGDKDIKKTCLWLKNLPALRYNEIDTLFGKKTSVEPEYIEYKSKGNKSGKSKYPVLWGPGRRCGKKRSVFFPGVATAMAEQWGQ
ncbi:MAG: hypothetical protein KAV87_00255 [Desulfobacteraceae bacterium]|nr:hypothetical protein [Desulfobacteraceae bacterium]